VGARVQLLSRGDAFELPRWGVDVGDASNHGYALLSGSSHDRKHSTIVASTLIQRLPTMITLSDVSPTAGLGPATLPEPLEVYSRSRSIATSADEPPDRVEF
jgi:hypothetical protein